MSRSFYLELAFFCLFLLLSSSKISAQYACLGVTTFREIDSNDEVERDIAADSFTAFVFDVHIDALLRLDIESSRNLEFRFYMNSSEESFVPRVVQEIDAGANAYSTVLWFRNEGQVCLFVNNRSNREVEYRFELSWVRFEDGRMTGVDDLTDVWGYNTIGNYYYYYRNYQEAYNSYRQALELNDGFAVIWSNLAGAAFQLGLYEEAITHSDVATGLDSEHVNAYRYRGLSYNALGNYEQAIEEFLILQDMEPYYAYWSLELGFQYIFAGEARAAVLTMQRYLTRSEESYEDFWLGIAEYNAGNTEQAIRRFEMTIEETEEDYRAFYYLWLGLAYRSAGREEDAEDAFDEADEQSRLDATVGQLEYFDAFAELSNGDYDDAQAIFEDMLERNSLPHRYRNVRLYLTVLARIFPEDARYTEMRDWINQELGMD